MNDDLDDKIVKAMENEDYELVDELYEELMECEFIL